MTWKYVKNLRDLRKAKGLTTHELEELTGGEVTRSVIANIECGRKSDINVDELIALAKALDVQPFVLDPRVSLGDAEIDSQIVDIIGHLGLTLRTLRRGMS